MNTAEQNLKGLGIELPAPPEPFGFYNEAVRTGNLLFLTGMLPTAGRSAKFVGRYGAEIVTERHVEIEKVYVPASWNTGMVAVQGADVGGW